MSTLSQFAGGNKPPKSLNMNYVPQTGHSSAPTQMQTITYWSGALTANTLKNIVTVSGSGVVQFLNFFTGDATSRTVRLQVVIDGVTVIDYTSAAIAANGNGICTIGAYLFDKLCDLDAVPFLTSLAINIASSLSETDKIAVGIRYYTT